MSSRQDLSLYGLGRLTGIFLILGFLLPMAIPSYRGMEFIFPNIQGLFMGRLSFTLVLMLLWPLIGGILAFVAVNKEKNGTRALFYLVIGFFPTLIGSSFGGMLGGMGGMGLGGGDMQMVGMLAGSSITSFLLTTGFLLMLSGAISGRARKNHYLPPLIAGIGGGMMLLALIIPINVGYGASIFLISLPFQAIGEAPIQGIGALVLFALIIAASVQSLIWAFKHKEGVDNSQAVVTILKGAYWFIIAFVFINILIYSRGRGLGMALPTVILGIVKVTTLIGGMLFAKVMFIAEITAYEGSQGNFDLATIIDQGKAQAAANANKNAQSSTADSTPTTEPKAAESPKEEIDPLAQEEAKMDKESKLKELESLKEKGLLSDEEFEAKKKELDEE